MTDYMVARFPAEGSAQSITQNKYENIDIAWKNLKFLADIEEAWEALIQNYVELEKGLLSSAVNSMVRSDRGYNRSQDDRVLFTRLLSNLLSTANAYLCHTPRYLNKINIENLTNSFNLARNEAYKKSFGYRLMYNLRNYAEHHGPALQGITYSSDWDTEKNGDVIRKTKNKYTVRPKISIDRLLETSKFKTVFRNELIEKRREGNNLEALYLVRDYVENLSGVHESLRHETRENYEIWCHEIYDTVMMVWPETRQSGNYTTIIKVDENTSLQTHVFTDMPRRIKKLRDKNWNLISLRRRSVNSELPIYDT